MIKMVATDIDGTIVKWDTGFSPNVKQCIKRLTKEGIINPSLRDYCFSASPLWHNVP